MRSTLTTLRTYIDFSLRLRAYVHNPITQAQAEQTILDQLANREDNFLKILKSNVFDYPQSPYLPLLKLANLTYADVEKMVAEIGLESTLEALYDAGVYVTFEEFKGRVPIQRGDFEYSPKESDFDNLNLSSVIGGSSGGSTGQSTRSKMDLDHIAQNSKQSSLYLSVHELFNAPKLIWWGMFPDAMGLMSSLAPAHVGHRVYRWFATYRGNESNTGWRYIIMTYLLIFMARFHGLKIPFPESTPLDSPLPIAHALTEAVQEHGAAFLVTTVSKCVRVSVAAQTNHIDLSGVTFLGSSEPVTPAKHAAILASGAKYISVYAATETGHIGLPCKHPIDITDVHFMSNNLALIQRPKDILDKTVDAYHFTSLLPSNPKMMINVQSDDYGIVEDRDCGCLFYEMGFKKHLRQMSSYRKLTGEGVTLVGSDMVHILEHVLPSQFGGSLLDYQLVEEETEQGFTKLILYVDPHISIADEGVLLQAFLDAMKQSMPSVRLAQAEYRTGDVVTIRREKPFVTSRGKHFPIRTLNMRS